MRWTAALMWSIGSGKASRPFSTRLSSCSPRHTRKERILLNSDLLQFLDVLLETEVQFLVVGGYAVMKYTEPRATKDIDLWIDTSSQNAERVYQALARFGAPLAGYTPQDFTDPNSFFQIGVKFRVDLTTKRATDRPQDRLDLQNLINALGRHS